MAKETHLNDIFTFLSDKKKPSSPHHFLFFLGTDTVFTKRPVSVDRSYENGETISYTAQVITTLLNETPKPSFALSSYTKGEITKLKKIAGSVNQKINSLDPEKDDYKKVAFDEREIQAIQEKLKGEKSKDALSLVSKFNADPLSYSSESVDVLNGPTTFGAEVGQRIAQGVFLALRAVASGKETLEILAHSRGAVEAMLVIHELQRIKEALEKEPDKSLYDILKDTPCKYTKAAIKEFFKNQTTESDNKEARQLLLKKLKELKINPFLIDPVPGGSRFGLPGAWHDSRFYKKLPCHVEQICMRDERTSCFETIVAEGIQPTVIPGHHGTASGNLYTQQLQDIDKNIQNRDTSTVQKLVLYKIFHFFHQATNKEIFQSGRESLNLEHKTLDQITNQFLKEQDKERDNSLINLYLDVNKNDEAFRSLTKHGYPYLDYLGLQEIEGQRIIRYRGHNDTSMATIAPSLKGGFVNTEHAMLYLKKYIDFDENASTTPDQLVMSIAKALNDLKEDMIKGLALKEENNSLSGSFIVVSQEEKKSCLRELVSTEDGQKLFFQGLSFLVNTISQKYLRNHLSTEERGQLKEAIKEPFKILKEIKANNDLSPQDKKVFNECEKILIENAQSTLEAYARSLTESTDRLNREVNVYLTIDEKFKEAFQAVQEQLSQKQEKNPAVKLICERLGLAQNESVNTIHQALTQEIENMKANESVKTEHMQELSSLLNPLNTYFELYQQNSLEYIQEIAKLYEANLGLAAAYPELKETLDNNPLIIDPDLLRKNGAYLLQLAGKILKEKQFDLKIRPENISESFFEKARKQAIAQGAEDPEKKELLAEKNDLQSKLEEEKILTEQQKKEIEEKKQAVQSLTQEKQSLEDANQKLKKQAADPRESKANLVIQEKLIPATLQYLQHLWEKAKKYNPGINTTSLEVLPDAQGLSEDNTRAYKLVKQKHDLVLGMYNELQNQDKSPLEKITQFKTSLNQANAALKQHRDSAWITFSKTCLAAIAIIITGIVPGLVALGIYSMKTGQSPLLFSQSKGHHYINECLHDLKTAPQA